MTSLLYDAPGPRAKTRNVVYTVVFIAVLALVAWWVIAVMADKGQFEWAKWKPFITAEAWDTYLLPALGNTLKAAGLALVIALPLGALFGIARLSDHRWVRVPAGAVVEFFRAIPVLILMLFANELYASFTDISSDIRPLYAVVTGLVLYNASVLAEVVEAGILSLPKGQTEAAQAIGLRKGQTMTNVLLPQAVTVMLLGDRQPARRHRQGHRFGWRVDRIRGAAPLRADDERVLREHHPQLHRRRRDLHRAELPADQLRQHAGEPDPAGQEIDGCGASRGSSRGYHGNRSRTVSVTLPAAPVTRPAQRAVGCLRPSHAPSVLAPHT